MNATANIEVAFVRNVEEEPPNADSLEPPKIPPPGRTVPGKTVTTTRAEIRFNDIIPRPVSAGHGGKTSLHGGFH